MIWALLATGVGCGALGIYVGGAGMCLLIGEKFALMKKAIARQAYELIDAQRERAVWQRRALIAEGRLPVQAVHEILEQERRVAP